MNEYDYLHDLSIIATILGSVESTENVRIVIAQIECTEEQKKQRSVCRVNNLYGIFTSTFFVFVLYCYCCRFIFCLFPLFISRQMGNFIRKIDNTLLKQTKLETIFFSPFQFGNKSAINWLFFIYDKKKLNWIRKKKKRKVNKGFMGYRNLMIKSRCIKSSFVTPSCDAIRSNFRSIFVAVHQEFFQALEHSADIAFPHRDFRLPIIPI